MPILMQVKKEHIPAVMGILNAGRAFQREQGFLQWPDGYPPQYVIEEDVEKGTGYVLLCQGEVAAYLYIGFDGDPAYPEIKGAWHYDEPYAVIHRMATSPSVRGKGMATEAFRLAEKICLAKGITNLRIDTDGQNKRMQHVLLKNGFSYCGTVIQGGGDRMAFDKKLEVR